MANSVQLDVSSFSSNKAELVSNQNYLLNPSQNKTTANVSTMAPSSSPEPDEADNDDKNVGKISVDSITLSSNVVAEYDITPKHHIRTPIIEETESGVEAELLRSRGNILSSSFNR